MNRTKGGPDVLILRTGFIIDMILSMCAYTSGTKPHHTSFFNIIKFTLETKVRNDFTRMKITIQLAKIYHFLYFSAKEFRNNL